MTQTGLMSSRLQGPFIAEIGASNLPSEKLEDHHDRREGCLLDVQSAKEGQGGAGQGLGREVEPSTRAVAWTNPSRTGCSPVAPGVEEVPTSGRADPMS